MAIDRETGRTNWTYQQPNDLTREAELKLYGAPAAVLDGSNVVFGFSDGAIVTLSVDKGSIQWSKRIGEGRYPDIVATPQLLGPDLFVSGYYKPVMALDRTSRNVLWRLDHGAASSALIEATDNGAAIYHPGRDGSLRRISGATGAIEWTWDSKTNGALEPTTANTGWRVGLIIRRLGVPD